MGEGGWKGTAEELREEGKDHTQWSSRGLVCRGGKQVWREIGAEGFKDGWTLANHTYQGQEERSTVRKARRESDSEKNRSRRKHHPSPGTPSMSLVHRSLSKKLGSSSFLQPLTHPKSETPDDLPPICSWMRFTWHLVTMYFLLS